MVEFPFSELFDEPLPRIKVIDVGALPVEGNQEVYQGLLDSSLCDLIAFEPDEVLCEKLNAESDGSRQYFPHVIGDGSEAIFKVCNPPYTSSIFEPKLPLLARFHNLSEFCQVVSREAVTTKSLDDLESVKDADFLKLDVQGASLEVIAGATNLLQEVTVVHTEVEFVPLYEGQPLFAEVDQAMRQRGFQFHKFTEVVGRAFKPMDMATVRKVGLSQILWSDAVFVKDFMAFDLLTSEQLLKLATLLHEVYRSFDLAMLCLTELDRRNGIKTAMEYQARLGSV